MRFGAWALSALLLAGGCHHASDGGADPNASNGSEARSARRSNASRTQADEDDAGTRTKKTSNARVPLSIQFAARVGAEDFACGEEYKQVGSSKTTVAPRDLRLFVQDVKLIDAAGEAVPLELDVRKPWQSADVALLDFEDGTGECVNGTADLNTRITGHAPDRTYKAIRFSNGVPDKLNHADPAELSDPLKRSSALSSGQKTGFRFIQLEVLQVGVNKSGSGQLHVGSTDCSGDVKAGTVECDKPNRNQVELTKFDPDVNTIVLDVAAVFADTDLTQAAQCDGTGDACASMFGAFGVDYSTGKPQKQQSVYSVE